MTKVPERDEFERNIKSVDPFLEGYGMDMGCGRCYLQKPNCVHVDLQDQKYIENAMGHPFPSTHTYHQGRADKITSFKLNGNDMKFDYIFSSHMVEDLPTKEDILNCLIGWTNNLLKIGGYIILLLPDMLGGRYPTVEEGGNPSHKVNMGVAFFNSILGDLWANDLNIVQMDTIPHESGCSFDVVLRKIRRHS